MKNRGRHSVLIPAGSLILALLAWTLAGCGSAANSVPVPPPSSSAATESATTSATSSAPAATAPAPAADPSPAKTAPLPPGHLSKAEAAAAAPLYRCPRVASIPESGPPLDPTAAPWNAAPVITGFLLCDARTPVTRKTEARMVWDDQALHILFVCDDAHVFSSFTEDQKPLFKEEVVEVFLDPNGEGTDYFEFEVSPRGKRFAAEIRNNGEVPPRFRPSRKLDPTGLTARVAVDGTLNNSADVDRRWTAAITIPFAYLDRPTPKPGEVWRGNLYRIDLNDPAGDPDEYSCWSPTHSPVPNFHISRYFGKIEFADATK